MILSKEYYLNTFGISPSDLETLTARALRGGGDYADLFFENTYNTSLALRDGKVSSGGASLDYGCGIRVLCGEKTGYAYAESTSMPQLLRAADAASAICKASSASDQRPSSSANRYFGKPNPAADRYPVVADWRISEVSEYLPFLEKLERLVRAKDSSVDKVMASINAFMTDVLMYNCYEELKYETRPLAAVNLAVIYKRGAQTQMKSVGRSFRMGVEFLTDGLAEELALQATSGIDERFAARRPKGGKMPVVMGAGASGILLHEAIGHAFEADFNRKGQSIFSEKMGKKICPENITVVDDGTLRFGRGSINYDDEGVPGQRTVMVENGVLTSYLHDRLSASFYGVAPTGNGRRESFRYNPIPRMRSTYMESGSDGSAADIISTVKKGIYVDEFANGEVKIGEGDFTFFVKSGFLIENGRLTMPVKDINVIGNGPEALANISSVGSDLKIDNGTWTCGKGQSIEVTCGIPTVLVNGLTVGGE